MNIMASVEVHMMWCCDPRSGATQKGALVSEIPTENIDGNKKPSSPPLLGRGTVTSLEM